MVEKCYDQLKSIMENVTSSDCTLIDKGNSSGDFIERKSKRLLQK